MSKVRSWFVLCKCLLKGEIIVPDYGLIYIIKYLCALVPCSWGFLFGCCFPWQYFFKSFLSVVLHNSCLSASLITNINPGATVGIHLGIQRVHLLCDFYLLLVVHVPLYVLELLCWYNSVLINRVEKYPGTTQFRALWNRTEGSQDMTHSTLLVYWSI